MNNTIIISAALIIFIPVWFTVRCMIKEGHVTTTTPILFGLGSRYRHNK